MTYTVFSDPHVGLNRKSHTTAASRKRLAEAVYSQALEIAAENDNVICAGDLFDSYSNSEDVIKRGANIVHNCNVVLAGNHDLSNRADREGSLQVLSYLAYEDKIASAAVGKVSVIYDDELPVVYIPHHSTQELFDQALQMFCDHGIPTDSLFLHCNFDNSMADGSDTSLNLTKAQVEMLLDRTNEIFIGHEHNPRELYNGRVVITGNTHPTSFSDISDKYIWHVDDGNVTKELVWDQAKGYREIKWEAGSSIPDLTGVEFVDITGETDKANRIELAKFVVEVWKASDTLLMVRNNVELTCADDTHAAKVDFADLPSEITKQVAGKDIESLWREYSDAEINKD